MKVTNTRIGAIIELNDELYVGLTPNSKVCYNHLVDELDVKHIVNMRHSETYYPAFADEDKKTRTHMLDFPDDASTWNESKLIKWFVDNAKTVAKLKGCIYIHNLSGRDEEVSLAFVVWAIRDPKTCPVNIQEWLEKHNYHMAIDNEERRRLTVAAIKVAKKPTLHHFLKK